MFIYSLTQQFEPRTNAEGLPLGQYRYEPKRLAMEAERNKDYNALLEKVALDMHIGKYKRVCVCVWPFLSPLCIV